MKVFRWLSNGGPTRYAGFERSTIIFGHRKTQSCVHALKGMLVWVSNGCLSCLFLLNLQKFKLWHCDFQQCGILTSVDSEEPVQPPFKLRNAKWCSVSSLTVIEYISDQQRLICAGRLVWAFAGRSYHIAGNLMSRLKCCLLCLDLKWTNLCAQIIMPIMSFHHRFQVEC